MNQALAFFLYSPLQSWGDIAVGEIRNSFRYPSKSALIGLLAGAMGLDRCVDESRILALNNGLNFAIRIDGEETMISDYHTVQVPPNKRGAGYRTRAAELQAEDLETILSSREYLCDAVFSVYCFGDAETLIQLQEKLIFPERPLYLGRKSCPLAMPTLAQIVKGPTLLSIQQQFAVPSEVREKAWVPFRNIGSDTGIVWGAGINAGITATRTIQRSDDIISRHRWQLGLRSESIGYVKMP